MTVFSKPYEQHYNYDAQYPTITNGVVVDTNDPQNCGRVRVMCPKYGDTIQMPIDDIPWSVNASAIMGTVAVGTRGPEFDTINGPTAYGFWNIPKVGTRVTVGCVDNDPRYRVYLGGGAQQFMMHTAPHGRWFAEDGTGPVSSTEQPILPLSRNIDKAFGPDMSPEKMTRAADYAQSRVDVSQLDATISSRPDDFEVKGANGWVSTNGYQVSRQDPTAPSAITSKNFDNQVTSLTSPGFHAISMDDRQENCRIRVRTTSGHQIIMDDTNERIYISTAEGENWIEMDQMGNIDIFSSGKISMHSQGDLNLTSSSLVNITGEAGVNIRSGTTINNSAPKFNVVTDTVAMLSSGNIGLEAGGNANIRASGSGNITASDINLAGGGSIIASAGVIHLNGPAAAEAGASGAIEAGFSTRTPQHEPWIRSSALDGQKSSDPQYTDPNDPNINKIDGDKKYERNPFWRR